MKLLQIFTSLTSPGLAGAMILASTLFAQPPPPDPPTAETIAAQKPSASEPSSPRREAGTKPAQSPEATESAESAPTTESTPAADAVDDLKDLGEGISEIIEEVVESSIEAATHDQVSHGEDHRDRHSGERVQFGSDVLVTADERVAGEVVAILGNVVINGETDREVVAILGNVTVNGSVNREVVAVLGNVTINGEVHREVVSVLGKIQLGPDAVVHGEIVSVGKDVDQAPGAVVHGPMNQINFLGDQEIDIEWLKAWFQPIKAWIQQCLLLGRPLALGENLGWAWMIAGAFLAAYILMGLLFPSAVTRCAETLETRPGMTVIASLLTLALVPIVMIALIVTVVGPPIMSLLLFFAGLFGKATFLAWMGRRIGIKMPALAVLVGGFIAMVIYLIPVVGFAFLTLGNTLGTGMVVYAIILAMNSSPDSPLPASPSGTGPPPLDGDAAMAGEDPAVTESAATAPREAITSAPISSPVDPLPPQPSTLSRVGFWARMAATLIDILVVTIVVNMLGVEDFFFIWAMVYFIAFWALRGTTLGGVVLNIKVVRLDDRPVDWTVALVRGLGSFLSLFALGLGFVWVAFDSQRQSWHDKIAGTTVVKLPKGVSLI